MKKTSAAAFILLFLVNSTVAAQEFATKFDLFGGSHKRTVADQSLVVFSTAWDQLVSEKNGTQFVYESKDYEALLSTDQGEAREIIHKALESEILKNLYSTPQTRAMFEEIYKYGLQTNSPVTAVPIGDAFDLYMAGKTINSGGQIPITADDENMFHDPHRALCIWLISCGWPRRE